jgi:hypothetical protein
MVSSTTVSIILLIVLIAPTIGFYIGSVAINIQKYTAGQCKFPEGVCAFGTAIGFPEGWMAPDTFIWYGIIPIMGVWLTIYGFMDKIKIFNGAITAGLSFVIAFSTIPLGLFVVMVVALYQLMGIYATMGLAILFLVGVFFEVRNRIGGMSGEHAAYSQQINTMKKNEENTKNRVKTVEDALKNAEDDIRKQKNMTEAGAIQAHDEIYALQQEREKLKGQLKMETIQRKRFTTLYSNIKKKK